MVKSQEKRGGLAMDTNARKHEELKADTDGDGILDSMEDAKNICFPSDGDIIGAE